MARTPTTRIAILEALESVGPMTARELREHLGMTRGAIVHSMTATRRLKPRPVRIADWQRSEGSSGDMAPVYALGRGPDAPKPPPYTGPQRAARHVEKYAALQKAKRRQREGCAVPTWLQGLL